MDRSVAQTALWERTRSIKDNGMTRLTEYRQIQIHILISITTITTITITATIIIYALVTILA